MICSKCQTNNPVGTKFCTHCGNSFVSSPPTPNISTFSSSPSESHFPSSFSFTDNPWIMAAIGFACGGGIPGVIVFYLIWRRNDWEMKKKIRFTALYLIVLYIIVFTSVFLIFGSVFSAYKSKQATLSSNQSFIKTTGKQGNGAGMIPLTPTPDLTVLAKYDKDSNGNAIPDFVETALGWDPTVEKCQEQACGKSETGTQSLSKKNILLILDSSGSMAESLGGEEKMTAAKSALTDYVNSLESNMNVALMVYGNHGSNSTDDKAISCKGIDILYPLGPVDKTKFNQAINSFQPTGWTPIGDALRKAQNEIFAGHENENNYIILVTDGIETCDSNPVTAVRQLEASGIKPVINVIGLAINSSDQSQLQQLADLGGGKYYAANSTKELSDALSANFKDMVSVVQDMHCLNVNFVTYGHCLDVEGVESGLYLMKITPASQAEKDKIKQVQDAIINRIRDLQSTSQQDYQINYNERQGVLNNLNEQQQNLSK